MITANQTNRLQDALQIYAGNEKITVEVIGGTVYAFGSELAVLRISRYYALSMHENKSRLNYSENLKTWFFSLDVNI